MRTRDYQLVREGKFNMKAIMQRAWCYVKNYRYSLKSALKKSWVDARIAMEDAIREEKPITFNRIALRDLLDALAFPQLIEEVATLRRNAMVNGKANV